MFHHHIHVHPPCSHTIHANDISNMKAYCWMTWWHGPGGGRFLLAFVLLRTCRGMNGAKITREWGHHWIDSHFLSLLMVRGWKKNGTQSSGDAGIPLIVVSKAMDVLSWLLKTEPFQSGQNIAGEYSHTLFHRGIGGAPKFYVENPVIEPNLSTDTLPHRGHTVL